MSKIETLQKKLDANNQKISDLKKQNKEIQKQIKKIQNKDRYSFVDELSDAEFKSVKDAVANLRTGEQKNQTQSEPQNNEF